MICLALLGMFAVLFLRLVYKRCFPSFGGGGNMIQLINNNSLALLSQVFSFSLQIGRNFMGCIFSLRDCAVYELPALVL